MVLGLARKDKVFPRRDTSEGCVIPEITNNVCNDIFASNKSPTTGNPEIRLVAGLHLEDFFYGYDKDFRKSGQKFTVRGKQYRAGRDIQICVREGSHPTTLRYEAGARDIDNLSVDVVIKISQVQHQRFIRIGDDLSIVLALDSISYSFRHDIWGIDRQRVMASARDGIGPDHVVKVEGAGMRLEGDSEKRGNVFVRFVRSV